MEVKLIIIIIIIISHNKTHYLTFKHLLRHLKILTIITLVSQELPEKLGGCNQMQVLKLDDNALTHLPESIGGLAELQELVVTQNDLETLPASMGLLRALHTLHLDDNLLTGVLISPPLPLPSLLPIYTFISLPILTLILLLSFLFFLSSFIIIRTVIFFPCSIYLQDVNVKPNISFILCQFLKLL